MPHVVTTTPIINGVPSGKPVVVEVADDKDPFEMLSLIQRRMFPGVDFGGRDRRLEEILAARARDAAAPAAEEEKSSAPDKGARFPRNWRREDSETLALDTQNEENSAIPDPERPEALAARPKAPEHRKHKQEEPSDTPPAKKIPAAAEVRDETFPASDSCASSPPRAAGAFSTTLDGDRPDAPSVNPRPSLAGLDGGSAPSGAGRGGVRDTSMAAFRALQWSGKLAAQEQLIVDLFLADPFQQRTRQEIARDLKLGINAVCGRVNALLKEPFNILQEQGKKDCTVTGNSVNALELARAPNHEEKIQ